MRYGRSFGALLACVAAPATVLGQAKPTLWVQLNNGYTVNSAATTNCDVIKMIIPVLNLNIVRTGSEDDQFQSALADGVATADALCTVIAAAPPARLAIHLNGFGNGGRYGDSNDVNADYWDPAPTLIFHSADRLSSSCSSGPQFQQTPWPDHARAECSAWMKGFCQQYRLRQASNSAIPNPEHISVDCEACPGSGNYLYSSLLAWTTYMGCLMSDPRSGASSSNSALWRYIPGNLGERKTLAQSYREARVRYDGDSSDTVLPLSSGAPDPAAVMSASTGVQRLFVTWLNGMWLSVRSDVLDSSARQVLAAYFPGCTFGNYNDCTADGKVDAALPPYVYQSPFGDHLFNNDPYVPLAGTSGCRLDYDDYTGWNSFPMNNLCPVDSPSFYGLGSASGWVSTSEDYDTEYLRFVGGKLDAINFSSDRTRRHMVMPWIAGKPVLTGWGFTVTDNWYRDLFALGRAKGVKDYLYFQPTPSISSTDKAAIDTVMGDVWNASVACAAANLGTITTTGDLAAKLSESDAVMVDETAAAFGGTYKVDCDVHFKLKSGYSPSKFKVVVEAHATYDDLSTPSDPSEIVLSIWPNRVSDGYYGSGNPHSAFNGATPVPVSGSLVVSSGSSYIVSASSSGTCSSDNEIWIRVTGQLTGSAKAFTIHIDNVQLYGCD